jgi:hypothetical protein
MNFICRFKPALMRPVLMKLSLAIINAFIAKVIDRKADRDSGFATWQTSVSNAQGAKRVLRGWAQSIRDGLGEANAVTASASPD